jgi:hypothetical protein
VQIKRRGLRATLLAAGVFVAAGSGTAWADSTDTNIGIANGNQVTAPISVAADVCGNSVAVLGTATSGCEGGAWAASTVRSSNNTTSGNYGILNGNQITAPIAAAVDVCGNAISVLGSALASCTGGANASSSVSGGGNKDGDYKKSAMSSQPQASTSAKKLPALPVGLAGLPVLPSALPKLPPLPVLLPRLPGLPLLCGCVLRGLPALPLALPTLPALTLPRGLPVGALPRLPVGALPRLPVALPVLPLGLPSL